jgi:carbon monoxide dehydrogenase subunit G
MIRLIERRFEVAAPAADAWRFLARVEEWPRWAAHIARVEMSPPGEAQPQSSGTIHLRNGIRSTFRMTEFNSGKNWKWAGKFLWLTVHYDHRFEAIDARTTRLTWIVDAEGFGAAALGRIFALVYSRNLDKAIPALVEAMAGR